MEKLIFDEIKENLNRYKYNSLKYSVYEDIAMYEVVRFDRQLILLFGNKQQGKYNKFHWAANEPMELLDEIKKANQKGVISFVPPYWVEGFKRAGLEMYGVFRDYFNYNITGVTEPEQPMEFLVREECREAAEVTAACRGQSRGFEGETEEWMRDWISGTDAYAADSGVTDCAALVYRIGGKIVGVACVGIYAHESEKGAILWLREIAVLPEYQGKGVGALLISQAVYYGKARGAKRAFLMADDLNSTAIRLYERAGFQSNNNEAQIDMILE